MSDSYPCPCCGHRVLDAPGSYEICPVCFWEDDGVQFRWPTVAGGANQVSLIDAQRNYQDFGACDEHGRQFVRPRPRTSRSTPTGSTAPTCTRRGDRCRSNTPRKSATAT
ncbi:CPCC family cysteine-rich protein [Streptomyces sp. IBSBF 3352]|uniref:CPCC family cysteine-rich protein n=1 Tax=Streptomyces sp. IBSBF 3352 TaxID=2903523 RepID=UPI002FDC1B68